MKEPTLFYVHYEKSETLQRTLSTCICVNPRFLDKMVTPHLGLRTHELYEEIGNIIAKILSV